MEILLGPKMGLEFNKNEYDQINDYCNELKIDWFASALGSK